MTRSRAGDWWAGVRAGWAILTLAFVVFWRLARNKKARADDKASRDAKGEAAKAREAGRRSDGQGALDSFDEATRK